jgi:hypothetical protein
MLEGMGDSGALELKHDPSQFDIKVLFIWANHKVSSLSRIKRLKIKLAMKVHFV